MSTWADLITASLKRINVLQANESPSPEDQADAFLRLQDLMESWQTERLTQAYILRTTWTITSTKGTLASPYTVGTGGDINVLRPVIIDHVNYQDTSVTPTLERPLSYLTDDAWAAIPQKNLTGALPVACYYNPTYASGLGSIYLWMIPTQANLQGVLYAPSATATPVNLTDTVLLPPGYKRFIRENLAVELATEFLQNVPVDPTLVHSAMESKAQIKVANMRPLDMSIDAALTLRNGIYDINADVNR